MTRAKLLPILVVAGVLLLGGGIFLSYRQYSKSNPGQNGSKEEVKKLTLEVGKIIDLPSEEPTIATVTDINKLKDQPFFQKAQNGDKVLIYPNAKKAILYNPKLKKVIDVAPLNIGSPSAQVAPANFKIVLRNGTSMGGLTGKIESQIKKDQPSLTVVTRDNSAKTDYDKTVVVVLNEAAKDAAVLLAKSLQASLENLPGNETRPEGGADILVILGKDKTQT